jgi:hypothetical protein
MKTGIKRIARNHPKVKIVNFYAWGYKKAI